MHQSAFDISALKEALSLIRWARPVRIDSLAKLAGVCGPIPSD